MKGTIFKLCKNKYDSMTFGFISSKELTGETLFFHKSVLTNCNISQLQEGDDVEFEVGRGDDGRTRAVKVRFLSSLQKKVASDSIVVCGINPFVYDAMAEKQFNSDVESIIKNLGKIFYITHADDITISNSSYYYCLAKPTDTFTKVFHLKREIIVLISDYINYEPRDNDVYELIQKRIGAQIRLEKAMHVIIHHDSAVSEKMKTYLTDNTHKQIIIPFSFNECLDSSFNERIVQNRFKEWLFDVDMFADVDPITNEVFFFGRRDFVNDIADKCKTGSNSGVFGLRRSGKTSVLYAVQRQLEAMGSNPPFYYVYIPCNDLISMNWRMALHYITQQVFKTVKGVDMLDIEMYDSDNTVISFENDLTKILQDLENPLTLMFDEIENLTMFSSTDPDHNFKQNDFLLFWNTIKGFYTKHQNKLSLLIAGTNPLINEVAIINASPNPMYATLASTNQGTYLKPFGFVEIKNMVNTLGKYMGLEFSGDVISRLKEDCGGHPYLIRMTCSYINRYVKEAKLTRPIKITKSIYDKAIPNFECSPEAESFFNMILAILITDYPTEYSTLKLLAIEGDRYISKIKTSQELHHLIGYGLVENNQQNYCIRYNTVNRYLSGKYQFERIGLSLEDQKSEISHRLGAAEISLRKLIKRNLKQFMGASAGKQVVINAMQKNNASNISSIIHKAQSLDFDTGLFDPSLNPGLYLSVLSIIIQDNLQCFQFTFNNTNAADIQKHLEVLNKSRRCPAHSYDDDSVAWTDEDFNQFRISMKWLEEIIQANE